MSDIYDQHKAAFSRVEAHVIVKDGQRVATIAFKFPADGAGRLFAYVHWLGVPMVRGFAAGGGYDKRSAACASATRRAIKEIKNPESSPDMFSRASFFRVLSLDDGYHWYENLEKAGFTVWQAV